MSNPNDPQPPARPAASTGTQFATPGAAPAAPSEGDLLQRIPFKLRPRPAVAVAAAHAPAVPRLVYPKLPPEKLLPVNVTGRLLAYASPDSTFAVTKSLIDSAQRSIVIGIYDFNASYIKEPLKDAMRRGVTVALMLDVDHADDPQLFVELRALGANCVIAPTKTNPLHYFDNAHEKIICVDDRVVMVQSGNWSENSIPFNTGDGVLVGQYHFGNRDMGLAVESPELTRFFAELIARDMRLAQGQPPELAPAAGHALAAAVVAPGGETIFERAPDTIPSPLFQSFSVMPTAPVRITPAISPENFYDVARAFLRSATRSIRIEQQYIKGGQPAVTALLDEMKAARAEHPGLQIQIIVSPKYLLEPDKSKFLQAMADYQFAFDENFRFLSDKHFVHCHNKVIIVDGERVLLGSQNWSTTALLTNREASLLNEHVGVAGYFAQIFDADWSMSKPSTATPAAQAAGAERIVDASDFAQGGVVISRVRDYEEV